MASTQSTPPRARHAVKSDRANFWCHVVEGSLAALGLQIVSGAEVLPVLVTGELGGSNTTLGLVTAVASLAFIVPMLLAPWLEAARRRKRLVLLFGAGQRLPLLIIGVGILFLGRSAPGLCLVLIALMLLGQKLAGSVQGPPWLDLIAETIPSRRHGHFWGFRHGLSAGMGLLAGPLCLGILATGSFPGSYFMLYMIAFGLSGVSWFLFTMVKDVPDSVPRRVRQPAGHYFRRLLGALHEDRNYRNFLLFNVVRHIGIAAIPFYMVVAVQYHGMPKAVAIFYVIVTRRLARIVGTFIAPFLAERIGHKRVIQLGNTLAVTSALLAAYTPRGNWALFLVAVAFWSVGGSARGVSAMSYSLRLYPRGKRIGYSTLSTAVKSLVGMVALVAAGGLMDVFGHTVMFSLAAAMNVAAIVPLEHCHAPDRPQDAEEPPPEAA